MSLFLPPSFGLRGRPLLILVALAVWLSGCGKMPRDVMVPPGDGRAVPERVYLNPVTDPAP